MYSHQSCETNQMFFNAETNSSDVSHIIPIPKKKGSSKISLLLSHQEQQDQYQDQLDNKMQYEGIMEESYELEAFPMKRSNQSCYDFRKIDICLTLYFLVKVRDIEHLYETRVFLPKDSTIHKVIQKAIEKFNEEKYTLNDPKSNQPLYELKFQGDDISKYELKPCKKNGYPKYDYPKFNQRMKVSDAQATSFSILFDRSLLILLPCSKSQKSQMCKDIKCLIF